jgi:hypothetical protein
VDGDELWRVSKLLSSASREALRPEDAKKTPKHNMSSIPFHVRRTIVREEELARRSAQEKA